MFELNHGQYHFTYELIRAKRKSISLKVNPDLSLTIKAPWHTSQKWVEEFIQAKAVWILKRQQALAEKHHRLKNRFEPGSPFYFLGKEYSLAISNNPSISFSESKLLLASHIKPVIQLKHWCFNQAQLLFPERLNSRYEAIKHLNIPEPKALRIKALKSRWGSCSSQGFINLNIDLIQLPQHCIDYVIIHELCHLLELNHGRGFYQLMDQACEGWQNTRAELKIWQHKIIPLSEKSYVHSN